MLRLVPHFLLAGCPCTSSQFDKKCGGLFFRLFGALVFSCHPVIFPLVFGGVRGPEAGGDIPIKVTADMGFRRRFGPPQIPAKNKGK